MKHTDFAAGSAGFPPKALALALLFFAAAVVSGSAQLLVFTTTSNAVVMSLSASDYDLATGDGVATSLAAHTFGIKSTSNTWTLSVRSQTSTFSFTPSHSDANPSKPCGDLAIRENATTTWIPVSTGSQVVATGPKQNIIALPKQLPIDYRFSTKLKTDIPGSYVVTLIYTLTQP